MINLMKRWMPCLLTLVAQVGFIHAETCDDYRGFWVLDRVNTERKNYREIYYGPSMVAETRGYYEIFAPKDIYLEHSAGRLKDSVGKCFEILDTALQQDTNGVAKGSISTGKWFALPGLVKDKNGQIVMREVHENMGTLDTIDVRYVSSSPNFKNKALLVTTRVFPWRRPVSFAHPMLGMFEINGRKRDRVFGNHL